MSSMDGVRLNKLLQISNAAMGLPPFPFCRKENGRHVHLPPPTGFALVTTFRTS